MSSSAAQPAETARLVESEPSVKLATIPDLRRLYEEHADFVRAGVLRLGGDWADADDLVHEVFMVALQRAKSFEGRSSVRTWLYGIAVKVVGRARRRARVRRFLGLDSLSEQNEVSNQPDPGRAFEQTEARRTIYRLLDKIAEKKRTVFILFELEELSGEEIAKIVGCPLKTVWTRLFYARKEFLRLLEKEEAQGTLLWLETQITGQENKR
jgi:RNA polymerase sigma-70 factor (ECF subfamily)